MSFRKTHSQADGFAVERSGTNVLMKGPAGVESQPASSTAEPSAWESFCNAFRFGRNRTLILAALLLSLPAAAQADDPAAEPGEAAAAPATEKPASKEDPAGVAFFESRIRPVLVRHCYECHSEESGAAEGGLMVDDRAALRAGGDRGPAVVPGRPEASVLLTAMSHADADLKMPPKEQRLSDDVLHDFRKWIQMGAPDPRDGKPAPAKEWPGLEAAREFWAYQPPTAVAAPDVADPAWPRDSVDHFILRKLTDSGLRPTEDASPETLLRRLHFDLVGLPPSPEDLANFFAASEAEGIDTALAGEVDRLLTLPQFGEHWGRHWLDVARFGESSGKQANIPFPYAWRYRDYVIDAVNDDLPIDRFFTEQIAGDLLEASSNEERARLLVATGYLAVGTKNLSEQNGWQFLADIIDEQIDSLSRSMLGSSIACARCHDHKFDPFAMQDYYALAGIFASTKTHFGTFVSPASQQGGELLQLPRHQGDVALHKSVPEKRLQQMKEQLAELKAEKAEMDAALQAVFAGKKPEKTFTLTQALSNIWRTGPIVGTLQIVDDTGQAIPVAMGTLDREQIVDVPLLARGDINRPGEPVARAYPRAIDVPDAPGIPDDQSGRLELAAWITHPQHPLTGRVFVNRVWHYLFGAGLVSTVDDFGTTGETPSHPELLDTLAVEFVEDGWSLKRLVRRLVLSRTYRQASTFDNDAFLADPENRLLWRMPKRRLPAEAIRDAMLVASGELDVSRPAGSLVGTHILDKPISLIGLDKNLPPDLDGSRHRSVYLPIIRDRLPEVLDLFDFAEPSLVTGDRETTNVPVQALYLMNSPFVQQRAEGLASRLSRGSSDPARQVEEAFVLCYGRLPDPQERARSLEYLQPAPAESEADVEDDRSKRLTSFCQALFCTAEFRNID
jgi:hypothetical protein